MAHDTVTIGKTDVQTTPLGLGTNAVGGNNLFPDLKDADGLELVTTALNHGIHLLDTAFAYGWGHSEELVGQAMHNFNRHSFTLATKGAQDLSSGNAVINNRPDFLTQQVEDSLRRLKTDYLDIYYIHFPDQDTPKYEAVGALQRLREQGKIRAIGVSNFSLAQVKEANADGYVDVVEDEYSLLHQQLAADLLPYLRDHQISFVPYFPLASGLLTGKYAQAVTFPSDDIRHTNPDFQAPRYAKILKAVDLIRPIATAHNATVAQTVLAWYLQNPLISVVIPGAKHASQVETNAHAMTMTLSSADYQQIQAAFAAF